MMRRWMFCLLLFFVPTTVFAQAGPDRLLPSGSQVYLRWDGFGAHRAAYEKSALGMTMKGDTGKFLSALWTYAIDSLEAAANLADPQAAGFIQDANKVLSSLSQNGFALGVEVRGIVPPDVHGVLVFPKSAPVLMPLVQKALAAARANVKETKIGKRTVYSYSDGNGPVSVGWWSEGDDAVLVVGTGEAEAYAKRIDANETGLASHPIHKKLAAFKEFPIWARAYIDLAGAWKTGAAASPEAGKIIEQLGLKGLDSITFLSGFDGPAERSLTDFNISGQRTGLLALLNKKTFTLADLPALPSDVNGFSASNFNLKNLYEGGVQIAEVATRVFAPGVDVRDAIGQVEGLIGIKLGDDLFGAFEGMSVSYSSPSEGLLTFGSVLMLKVKDEKKLLGSLDTIFKGIPALPGVEVAYEKKDYRGVQIHNVQLRANEFSSSLGYFTVHKGWFLLSNTPQPLYGFVLRSKGDLPVWKASPKLLKALDAFPQEFTAISVSDPRPTVEFLLAAMPTVFTITNAFAGQLGMFAPGAPNLKAFDLTLIPHAQEATRYLFPNISVSTDDGKRLRTDTRASLAIPFVN